MLKASNVYSINVPEFKVPQASSLNSRKQGCLRYYLRQCLPGDTPAADKSQVPGLTDFVLLMLDNYYSSG